ncbi:hypothetical protein [Clostridium sp. KNHs216]|uniref:hypothetical protein n=1 Tax=Clostridium sp. KNHs216 TaxID=1550235 RepID=UPI0011500F80|nr:hypothetical protein [Clostridium sp. KNHs216]TQI67320.1 hypothetical protein LY85_2007 [Clostridium sp. KNHs216]
MNQEKELRKENNKKDKLLTKENNRLLTDMIVYLHSGNLCEYDIEIIRKELLGMALETQIRNDDFRNVVGENYKTFCDELMKNGRRKTKYERALEWLSAGSFAIGVLFLFEYLSDEILAGVKLGWNALSLNMPVSWGFTLSTLCCIPAAFLIYHFFSVNSFDIDLLKYKIMFGLLVGFSAAAIFAVRFFMDKMILCTVNVIYPAMLIAALYVLVKILETRHANYLAQTHN